MLGVKAQMAERGRPEEKIEGGGSLGLVDISEGSIRWVNVRRQKTSGSDSGGGDAPFYCTVYGVPDPKARPGYDRVDISTVRVKTSPLVGQVVDLRWQGDDLGTGLIDLLKGDLSLNDPLMTSTDLKIRYYDEYGCWIMSTPWIPSGLLRSWRAVLIPSAELWRCYEAIAQHLLATESPRGR
jgi:hypothetical protein